MAFERLTDAQCGEVIAAAAAHESSAAAARALGINRTTYLSRLKIARHRADPANAPPLRKPKAPPPQPERSQAEIHNARFWRQKYQAAEKEIGRLGHLAEELTGVRNVPYQIPDWLLSSHSGGARGRSVIACLISDVHMGEVIAKEEIHGINSFDEAICRARLRRYFTAACAVGQRWAHDTDCAGALMVLAGDLISGDIHEELRNTNCLTSHEQVQAMIEEMAAGIQILAATFGRVHVVCVPGNHGRNTPKSTAKLYARLSYDMAIGAALAREFANDPRISFQMSAAKDQHVPVFGRTVLVTHGDKTGTGGGMGFAGPALPIVRGAKKIEAQQASVGRKPDAIFHGHWHTSLNIGNIFSNGSVPGYSEYGDDLRAAVEPPQQWLIELHSRWWLRQRMPVQLEEPHLPEKPRVRVPAWAADDGVKKR